MPLNYIKRGVRLSTLTPIQIAIWTVVSSVFFESERNCTLTDAGRTRPSGSGALSMHHVDRALDFRLNDMPREVAERITSTVRGCLSEDFDVLSHGEGANFHLHVEYDPRD